MRLGIARADITPPFPVRLAGFSSRRHPHEGVSRRLYVRAWLFEGGAGAAAGRSEDATGRAGVGGRHKALIIQADLIWWGSEYVPLMRDTIAERWGIPPQNVLFQASHTHSGPQTTSRFSPLLAPLNEDYAAWLEEAVYGAVERAHADLEEVSLERGSGLCEGIGVNRRLIVDGKAEFAPNEAGVRDDTVTVVRAVTDSGRLKGVLFHFTCHPTTTDANQVSSEYCGVAMERLDEEWGDGVSCFLQGCCGDIRPAIHRNGAFFKADPGEVDRLGERLAAAVRSVVGQPMVRLEPLLPEGRTLTISLPFARVPEAAEIAEAEDDDEVTAVWKSMMRDRAARPETEATLELQTLRLARGLSLMALNGEIVVEYGLQIRQATGGEALPLGYSNGMIGYVSTAKQLDEGGYESISSGYLFAFPSPFSPEAEPRLREAIRSMAAGAASGSA